MIRSSPLATSDRWTRPSSAPLHQAKQHRPQATSAAPTPDAGTSSTPSVHWSSAIPIERSDTRLASAHPLQPVPKIRGRSRKLNFVESRLHLLQRSGDESSSPPSLSMLSMSDHGRYFASVNASTPAPVPRNPYANPASFETRLNEDLSKVSATDEYRRLNAHRLAFSNYIDEQDEPTQVFLRRILTAYESIEVHKFKSSFDEVSERLHAAELVAREAINERNMLQLRCESLELSILNLEKQLNARNELISQISHQYRINTASLNWMTGEVSGSASTAAAAPKKSRTMAEIRAVQARVALTHNEAMKQSAKENRGEDNAAAADTATSALLEQIEQAIQEGGAGAFHGVPAPSGRRSVSELYVMSGYDENVGVELLPEELVQQGGADVRTSHTGEGKSLNSSPARGGGHL